MFEMKIKFLELVKSIVFRCLRPNKSVGCSEYIYASRNRQGKQAFVKENEKKYIKEISICKTFKIYIIKFPSI